MGKDTKFLMQFLNENYSDLLKFHLTKKGINIDEDDDLRSLLSDEQIFSRCVESIQSVYKHQQYCVDNIDLIEPETFVLCMNQNEEPETMQYVSIIKVLKLLLRKEEIASHILTKRYEKKDYFQDYEDGEICQRHDLFSKDPTAIRIHLYTDEVEIVNPLR